MMECLGTKLENDGCESMLSPSLSKQLSFIRSSREAVDDLEERLAAPVGLSHTAGLAKGALRASEDRRELQGAVLAHGHEAPIANPRRAALA